MDATTLKFLNVSLFCHSYCAEPLINDQASFEAVTKHDKNKHEEYVLQKDLAGVRFLKTYIQRGDTCGNYGNVLLGVG